MKKIALFTMTILIAGLLPMVGAAQLNCSGGIWGCITPWSANSIPFVGSNGALTQDATYFVYNNSTQKLGVGVTSPSFNGHFGGTLGVAHVSSGAPDGTRLSITPGAANGSVVIDLNASSGAYPPLIFKLSDSNGLTLNADHSITNDSTAAMTGYKLGSNLALSSTAPTISSGFGTNPSIVSGSAASFRVNVGTGGTANTGVIGLPTATNGWNCDFAVLTNAASFITAPTTSDTTTVTVANYSRTTGLLTAWTASDIVGARCTGF